MSAQDKAESNVVQLVAIEPGTLRRHGVGEVRIEAGTSFSFDRTPHPATPPAKLDKDGLRRLPKWARLKDEAQKVLAQKAAVSKAVDTRPVAAKAAVKQKAAAMSGAGDELA